MSTSRCGSEVADLFAAEGTFEYGQMGVYVGKAHIRRALLLLGEEGPEPGKLNNYMQLQSVIDVAPDGRDRQGALARHGPARPGHQSGQWGEGTYENEYVKQNGVWKLARLHFYTPASPTTTWAGPSPPSPCRGRAPSSRRTRRRPRSIASFPGVYIPPFDYPHPVTGEADRDIPEPARSRPGAQ